MNFFHLHPNIRYRVLIIFVTTLTNNMIFPFMAIYFVKNIGPIETSIFLSIAIVINFMASIWGGDFADRVGRKRIMVIAEVLRVISFTMFVVSNSPWSDWPYVTLVFFMLNNVSSGLYNPASEAMLLDVTSPEERKYMYSIIYWISNLSIALGGAIGAIFFEEYLFNLFIALTISSVVSVIITQYLMTETLEQKQGKSNVTSKGKAQYINLLQNYKVVLRDKVFIIFVFSSMLLFSLESHLTNFIAVRLEKEVTNETLWPFDWQITGIELLGFLRAENTILVVILSIVITRIIKKYNEKSLIFLGFLLYIIGYGILSFSNTPWLLLGVMAFAVIGEVMAFPIHQSYLGDIIPENLRSSYLAMNRIALKGSALFGSIGIFLFSILPNFIVSLLVWLSGIVGLILFYRILPTIYNMRLQHQKRKKEELV